MKTNLNRLLRAGVSGCLAIAALLLSGSAQTGRAASADPSAGTSYTWDCLSSGSGQRGIAFITFSNDFTFRGYQMWASTPPATNSTSDGRGGGIETRGSGLSGSSSVSNSFVFGFAPIGGRWEMNLKKQIVGFFAVVLNATSVGTNYQAGSIMETITNFQTFETTNITVLFAEGQSEIVTNFAWADPPPGHTTSYTLLNTNITTGVNSGASTNAVSFTGTATAGKRLNLVASTTFGKVTYKGVPLVVLSDLTGSWVGSKHENNEQYNEFFDLISFSVDNPFPTDFPDIASFPNIYFTTNGAGPGYMFDGVVMASAQKKIGFIFSETADGTNSTLRASVGGLSISKKGISGNTTGIEEPANRINFTAGLVAAP